ncbi:MAG: hypothetical protein ACRD8Z_12015, partial [Nitrososphaeraceae archaeon]
MTLMMKREITKGHLPRIRLEYDRLETELHSLKDELSNSVLIYQDFCARTLVLKKREDELLHTINELRSKKSELQKVRLNKSLLQSEYQDSNADFINPNPEIKQEDIISMNDVFFGPIPKNVVANRILIHRIGQTSSP